MNIPAAPVSNGETVSGKVSWFGGPNDAETGVNKTASGAPTSTPGIAIYNRATLGGYWRVTAANGRSVVLKQTDLGPAPFTGRKIDITYSALGKLGYKESNFPTDAQFKATYLGTTPPAGGAGETASAAPTVTASPGVSKAATTLDVPGLEKAQQTAAIDRVLLPQLGGGTDNPLRLVMPTAEPNPANFEQAAAGASPAAPPTSAGMPSASGKGVNGYINPLPGFTQGRTDMGVDLSATPGKPILALGNGKVIEIQHNWYKGQPLVSYELTDGPQKGKVVYVAEQITPSVKVGDTVRAGQRIGVYAPTGTGVETGFGTRSGSTLAQSTTGYTEGQATPAGKAFEHFLAELGAAKGQSLSHPEANTVRAPSPGAVVSSYSTPRGPVAIVHHTSGKLQHVRSSLPVGHKYAAGDVLGGLLKAGIG